MILQRITSDGISHHSYFLGYGTGAVVIDPRRDCEVYVDLARQQGMKIKYILETHRNEDYVIGSLELSNITGAEIWHGPGLDWKYGNTLQDGQTFQVGKIKITALHTPGHTDESMSYALADLATGGATVGIFTGDALFVGDVGRTDLYGAQEAPRLAAALYDSLFKKLLPLGDGVIIYPGHGGGSVCGIHIADRNESTIGLEKEQNPALRVKTREDFVKYKLAEKPERPPYFTLMEKYNLEGAPLLQRLPLPSPLSAKEFRDEMERGAVVVDMSEPAAFAGIHIKGAYSIWDEGLPNFAGWVLPYDKPLLLVMEGLKVPEKAVRYLIRAGYDRISGYLKDGMDSWFNAGLQFESLNLLTVHRLKDMLDRREPLTLLDTRAESEWQTGHIAGAKNIYVGHLEQRISEVPRDKPVAVYCSTGHRSGIASSILLRAGFPAVYNIPGSITAWTAAGFPLVKN